MPRYVPLTQAAPPRCSAEDLGDVHRARAVPSAGAACRRCASGRSCRRRTAPRRRCPRTLRTLSAPMAAETSAFLTAKVPPKPQHSSAPGSSRSSRPSTASQQPAGPVAEAAAPQPVTGGVVGDPVREVCADVGHPEDVDQELGQLVGDAGAPAPRRGPARLEPSRVLLAHHGGAGPDGARRRRIRRRPRRSGGQRHGLVPVAGVEVHLAAARLRGRGSPPRSRAAQERHDGPAGAGKSVSLTQVMNRATRTPPPFVFPVVGAGPPGTSFRCGRAPPARPVTSPRHCRGHRTVRTSAAAGFHTAAVSPPLFRLEVSRAPAPGPRRCPVPTPPRGPRRRAAGRGTSCPMRRWSTQEQSDVRRSTWEVRPRSRSSSDGVSP